jgi:hypothetical protein
MNKLTPKRIFEVVDVNKELPKEDGVYCVLSKCNSKFPLETYDSLKFQQAAVELYPLSAIPRKLFFQGAKSDAAKQYHTKEARELIEELRDKLKKMSVRSFPPSLNEIFELATKTENFLKK